MAQRFPLRFLYALIAAYQAQIKWLITFATELESEGRRVVTGVGEQEFDLSSTVAKEYRSKAEHMQAVLEAYERLSAKGT